MFKNFFKINFIFFLFASISYAEIINDVVVAGNQRISKDTIIVLGSIQLKSDYSNEDLNVILKNLYNTNFFDKINIKIDNNILIIDVSENPIIEDVEINGIKSAKLTEFINDSITLKSRNSYNESLFMKDVNTVKSIIRANGYYFSNVKTSSIINDKQNSIKLIYDIDLGKEAKIDQIVFLGDKKIKDRKLNNIITSEVHQFWKFISKRSKLNKERIQLDIRLLTNYYKDNGYYDASIRNSFVEFKDDGRFKLIYDIDAGEKFFFNKFDMPIPDDFNPESFKKIFDLFKKYENDEYSLYKINKILNEIDKVAISKKYEFIDATIEEKVVSNNKINFKVNLNETEKHYVERINIYGNEFTLEEVIRNSLIVDEGDPLNQILLNKSINNLKSKNIFKTVEKNIYDGSEKNRKIIDITVQEKPTGEISLGAGYGSTGGTIGAGIKENNFLGKGINLNTNFTLSQDSIKGQFVYSKPNFNNTENTLFTTFKSISTDKLVDFGYKTNELGASIGTQFQQYENFYFNPEISATYESIETSSSATSGKKKQAGDFVDFNFVYSLNYDLRNKKYKPDEGFQNIFSQELPIISENFEITNSFETKKYQKLPSEMVGRLSFKIAAVNTLKDKDARLSKRLYIPANKLRGFEPGKVGPKDSSDDFIGGNYYTAINLSTTLPQVLPSFQNSDISLFMDAANIWGVDYDSSLEKNNNIKSSVGVAIDLLTPIGPLNFSLSQPITKSSSDITESFRFNLGTTF